MQWFQEKYIQKSNYNSIYNDWRVSPICSDQLGNLPPSLVIIAGCDPLKDEGLAYAEKLKKFGNNSEIIFFDGQIHGFLTMGARINDTKKLINIVAKKINTALEMLT
jgi:acetyl esterase